MALETGRYIIKNGENIVGRALAEDLSLRPKRVILTDHDSTVVIHFLQWAVEKLGNNLDTFYTLISNGSPTAHIEHNVYALVIDRELATKWYMRPIPQNGETAYIVTGTDREGGWVAPGKVGEQIEYKPLIVAPSEPPRYPTNQVFHFTKVED
ncbi:serine protease inhibitor [Lentinula lateritia]|nr:serine protease inhibitor [Lentinula lateritia]